MITRSAKDIAKGFSRKVSMISALALLCLLLPSFLVLSSYIVIQTNDSAIKAVETQCAQSVALGDHVQLSTVLGSIGHANPSITRLQLRDFNGNQLSSFARKRAFGFLSVSGFLASKQYTLRDISARPVAILETEFEVSLRWVIGSIIIALCIGILLRVFLERALVRFSDRLIAPVLKLPQAIAEGSSELIEYVEFKNVFEVIHNAKLRESDLIRLESRAREHELTLNFARQVAHDIRSPLSAISAAINRIPSNEESSSALRLLGLANVRIQMICNDLLSLRLSESSELLIESFEIEQVNAVEKFCLASAINEIVEEKKLYLGDSSKVQISFTQVSSAEAQFVCSSHGFKRMLSNLLNNAVEAIDGDGWVRIYLSITQDGHQIRIEDNGKGMSAEVIEKLGQNGFSYLKDGGNGLGFGSARRFAVSLGGDISVSSLLGAGTRVIIRLPFFQSL